MPPATPHRSPVTRHLDAALQEMCRDNPMLAHAIKTIELLTQPTASAPRSADIACPCGGTAALDHCDGLYHCPDCQAIWQDD